MQPENDLMRPVYETPATLAAERSIVSQLALRWRCLPKKLPRRYVFDYLLLRDGVGVAVCEIKVRTKFYNTYTIALSKIVEAKRYNDVGLTSILIVKWPTGIYYHTINGPYPVVWGGRTDRNDPDDQEPMASIADYDFLKL